MSANQRGEALTLAGMPPDAYSLMGVQLGPLVLAAEHVDRLSWGAAGRYSRQAQTAIGSVDKAILWGRAAMLAEPALDAMAAYPDPNEPIRQEMGKVRDAIRLEMTVQPEADSLAVARSLGSVVKRVVDRENPYALDTPILRTGFDILQLFKPNLTAQRVGEWPDGQTTFRKFVFSKTIDNERLLAAGAPEILTALGFAPEDPLMRAAQSNPESFLRSVAGKKLGVAQSEIPRIIEQLPHILRTAVFLRGVIKPAVQGLRASRVDTPALARQHAAYQDSRYDYAW